MAKQINKQKFDHRYLHTWYRYKFMNLCNMPRFIHTNAISTHGQGQRDEWSRNIVSRE